MVKDCFPHRCVIYRLQDINSYDFSGSSEGEVTEVWGIVAANERALFDWEDVPFSRREDGIKEIGGHKMYMGPTADVKNADRVYRALGEEGPTYYSVRRVRPIRDFQDKIHHKELDLDEIPWTLPLYSAVFVANSTGPNVSIRQHWFNFDDPAETIINLTGLISGDWLQSIGVQIITPFTDHASTITISDSEETLVLRDDLYVPDAYYEADVRKNYFANDALTFMIDPGESTAGQGIIFAQVLMNS